MNKHSKSKSRKSRTNKPSRSWTYARAFFITMGLGLVGVIALVWQIESENAESMTVKGWLILILLGALATCFIAIATLASNATVKKWTNSAGKHEAEALFAIIAAPVYFIGKLLAPPRRKR